MFLRIIELFNHILFFQHLNKYQRLIYIGTFRKIIIYINSKQFQNYLQSYLLKLVQMYLTYMINKQ
jgi:hypothetical protein